SAASGEAAGVGLSARSASTRRFMATRARPRRTRASSASSGESAFVSMPRRTAAASAFFPASKSARPFLSWRPARSPGGIAGRGLRLGGRGVLMVEPVERDRGRAPVALRVEGLGRSQERAGLLAGASAEGALERRQRLLALARLHVRVGGVEERGTRERSPFR